MAETVTLKIPFLLLMKDLTQKDAVKALTPTLEKIKNHAIERAVANTPIDTGALRKSINVVIDVEHSALNFTFTSNMDYVLKVHEKEYQLGPKSEAQPPTKEGGVGNKFFTRVIDEWAEIWAKWVIDALLTDFDKRVK